MRLVGYLNISIQLCGQEHTADMRFFCLKEAKNSSVAPRGKVYNICIAVRTMTARLCRCHLVPVFMARCGDGYVEWLFQNSVLSSVMMLRFAISACCFPYLAVTLYSSCRLQRLWCSTLLPAFYTRHILFS